MSEFMPRVKKITAVSALSMLALTGCTAKGSTAPAPTKPAYSIACNPENIILTTAVQDSILATHKWPANLNNLTHVGDILGIQYRSAARIDANILTPDLDRAHKIVGTFLGQFETPGATPKVEVIQDPTLTQGRVRITEFDQTCADEIAGIHMPIATKTA
jgi:hypothetical protein